MATLIEKAAADSLFVPQGGTISFELPRSSRHCPKQREEAPMRREQRERVVRGSDSIRELRSATRLLSQWLRQWRDATGSRRERRLLDGHDHDR